MSKSEDIIWRGVWIGSTLGDFIANELVYLLSVTDEPVP
jgi:hypothetical protein